MAENRQADEVRNDYLEKFKELQSKQIKLSKMMLFVFSVYLSPILLKVKHLTKRFSTEGSCERESTLCMIYYILVMLFPIWIIFVYCILKYVRNEEKLIKSGEHPEMNCDESEYDKNLESMRESYRSQKMFLIVIYTLLGLAFVSNCMANYFLWRARADCSEDPSDQIPSVTGILKFLMSP